MTICAKGTALVDATNAGLKDSTRKEKFRKGNSKKLSETVRDLADNDPLVDPYAQYLDDLPKKLQADVIAVGRQALDRGDQVQIDISFTYSAHSEHMSVHSEHVGGGGVVTTITLTIPPPP